MKKKILLSLFLATSSFNSIHAVHLGSKVEDEEALLRGKGAQNVCYLSFSVKNDDRKICPLKGGSGSGVLITPDIIATAGHVFYDPINDEIMDRTENKKHFKDIVKKLKSGNPLSFCGLATFAPDVNEALSTQIALSDSQSSPDVFYEIDSVILHPSYFIDGGEDSCSDFAFIKLKKSVEGILPLSLYEEGIIDPFGHHQINDPDLSTLIKTTFTGYGRELFGRFGKKRTVSQLSFLEEDSESSSESSADSELDSAPDIESPSKPQLDTSESSDANKSIDSSSNSDSDSDSDSNIDMPSIDNILTIVSYVPPRQEELITEDDKKSHQFHKVLYAEKKPGELYGLIYTGDSGGPLTVKNKEGHEFLIGIESGGGRLGHFDTYQVVHDKAKDYKTYFCPLFDKDGKLRPEISVMLEKLQNFDIAATTYLKDLILEEKRVFDDNEFVINYLLSIDSCISDLSNLLELDFTNKELMLREFEIMSQKYNMTCDISKEFLNNNDYEGFHSLIKESIKQSTEEKEKIIKILEKS